MAQEHGSKWPSFRGTLSRGRPSFLTRTATDDAGELLRRSSLPPDVRDLSDYGTIKQSPPEQRQTPLAVAQAVGHALPQESSSSPPPRRTSRNGLTEIDHDITSNTGSKASRKPKPAINVATKLDTFSGVFVPTSLNVLSILMFIRFGFILGQAGLLGMLGLLVAAYIINLVTTFSISAVASNGTVRGGGAYYLISRSLGPEFGGSIGIVSYIGFVLNTGMNAVGLVDCLIYNFGKESGIWSEWLPDSAWWPYLWSTVVVIFCVTICLAGSSLFARASNGLLLILLLATFSIPLSAMLVTPFTRAGHLRQYTHFTGITLHTLRQNLLPRFTKGAAGSQIKGRENWADMFGILYPATGGIYAGASMSGDLRNASKSIPSGTLYGIFLTFVSYALVILAMAASISRETFYRNVNVIQDVNISEVLVLLGEIATTSFSVLMGIIGPAKQLQAIARDGIFPGLGIFGKGTKGSDDPIYAILFTWLVAQVTILFDINSIASLVTMSYLMMNFALHLACILLKVSSAPNFRPSFKFFNIWTATVGAVLSIATMFFVDADAAAVSIAILVILFLVIHYTTPPKPWGSDVTSGLVYHQVRKYLLRLRTESVKYWRPQILLFVNDPRRGFKLIKFANSLKKGGLFILGHVIVTENFGDSIPEVKRQRAAWTQFIDLIKIKAFINVLSSPSMEWGSRNLVLSAGLGGMRPNIVMMGFFNLEQFRSEQPLVDIPSPPPERKNTGRLRRKSQGQVKGALPTDICFVEKRTDLQAYVLTLEDLVLKLKINVALATGFSDLELPEQKNGEITKKYIDLWPIQMSAEVPAGEDTGKQSNLTTTNFDTYTLILQLGCILNTVPSWKKTYKLRVAVFVEYESDVQEEKERVIALLENLRIKAEVIVFYLACGAIKSYNHIVNGQQVDEDTEKQVSQVLEDEEWWAELQRVRGKVRQGEMSAMDALSLADEVVWPPPSLGDGRDASLVRYGGLRKILQGPNRRSSIGNVSNMGVVPSMRTHRLDDDMLSRHASHASDHSSFEDSDGSDGDYLDDEDADDEYEGRYEDDAEQSEDLRSSDGQRTSKSPHSRPTSRKSSKKSSKKSSGRNSRASSLQAAPNDSLEDDNIFTHPNYNRPEEEEESPRDRGRTQLRSNRSVDANASDSPTTAQLDPGTTSSQRTRNTSPTFSADPIPETRETSHEEGAGPSIMFAKQTHPRHVDSSTRLKFDADVAAGPTNSRSIYVRGTSSDPPPISDRRESPSCATITSSSIASGYPAGASLPLSFNDLPCRAQHLILNELMAQNSQDAAVIFTTLPAPIEGTYKSESDSLSYISDLEVLTQGLGPVLMVHSNSMTVTTNL
ncbi:hypothetical protein LTS08_006008 [Lithohypha guttulata]|uniref:uncharacterized protein n=1 Tax=Lithohypha guttulata TaxID=1690604 RepID=UPI002DE1F06F|nr:hypothetical protein LTR51_002522 [Lithohypha guttulata]KAK5099426.1 hypothetical protein LTS08_006008 [Lithohypha guttulata]